MTEAYTSTANDAPEVALDTYRRLFVEGRESPNITTGRRQSSKFRRYYDGKPEKKLQQELRRKRQPDFTINRIRPAIEGMVGVVDKGKTDPRAYPRTPKDEGSSEVATDTLRYVCDVNRWQQMKLDVARNIWVEGTAAVLVEVDGKLEVRFRRIRFEEFFFDPYSRELDFSDASYMGCAKWQYVDEIAAVYPEKRAELVIACSQGDMGDSTWNDRPEDHSTMWSDPKRKRLLVVEMYKREGGTWLKCVFVGQLKLEEGESPYLDNDDKPCNPIEARSAYVDDENVRYSPVSDMVGPQDEINTYRRKGAFRATFRQLQETDPIAAYADPEEARREAAKPDGVIPPGYGIVPDDKFSMDMALLAEAKAEIERLGPNPGILGRGDASSGRQDLVRQQAGLTELAHLFSGLDDLELRIYRQAWARVRQFWTEPKFVRVTDDENAVKFIQINEPEYGPPQAVWDGQQFVMQTPVVGMKNAVAQMGVDIIVDSTPDTANVQQEQFTELVKLIPAMLQAGMRPPIKSLLKNSSLPHKREIIEEFEEANQPQGPQGPSPEQQQAMQLAMQEQQAKIGKTQADTMKSKADALKTMSETHTHLMTPSQPAPMPAAAPPPEQGF